MIVRSDIAQCKERATAFTLVKVLSDKFGYNIPFIAAQLITATQFKNGERDVPWTVQIAGAEWTVPELLVVIRVFAEGYVMGKES